MKNYYIRDLGQMLKEHNENLRLSNDLDDHDKL